MQQKKKTGEESPLAADAGGFSVLPPACFEEGCKQEIDGGVDADAEVAGRIKERFALIKI